MVLLATVWRKPKIVKHGDNWIVVFRDYRATANGQHIFDEWRDAVNFALEVEASYLHRRQLLRAQTAQVAGCSPF